MRVVKMNAPVEHLTESLSMMFCRLLGQEKIAWSFRRLHCPVDSDALVLEVGSGGNPYFRSNVLVDAYESTGERHWVPLTTDRPTVLAFVENLPFKDKSFDFVVKTPPAAVQLMEAAKLKSGSGEPNRKKVASVTWEQIRAIAEDKMPDLNAFTMESAMSMVAGTARSMGITVSGDVPF